MKKKLKKKDYAFSFINKFGTGKAAVVIDVDFEVIQSIISGIDFGPGSHVALLGNNDIMVSSGEEFDYANTAINIEIDKDGPVGYKEFKEINYYYSYKPVGDTGMYLTLWVPLDNIIK